MYSSLLLVNEKLHQQGYSKDQMPNSTYFCMQTQVTRLFFSASEQGIWGLLTIAMGSYYTYSGNSLDLFLNKKSVVFQAVFETRNFGFSKNQRILAHSAKKHFPIAKSSENFQPFLIREQVFYVKPPGTA